MKGFEDLQSSAVGEPQSVAAQNKKGALRGRRPRFSTVLLIIVFLVGLCLLLYPSVSEIVNEQSHSRAIADHQQALGKMDDATMEQWWNLALEYNAELAQSPKNWFLNEADTAVYNHMLDPFGTGMMGYLEIPSIRVRLPIYHGVDAAVLQSGVGHIASSSLPVGGESSHCVLSGHRGLPSARLLSDLDQMEVGNMFYLHVLDETLAYTVDDIRVVEPKDVESLGIKQGADYCTLVTCTPYGVNTHRLLVRGVRTPYTLETQQQMQEQSVSTSYNMLQAFPFVVAFVLLVVLVLLLACNREKRRKE